MPVFFCVKNTFGSSVNHIIGREKLITLYCTARNFGKTGNLLRFGNVGYLPSIQWHRCVRRLVGAGGPQKIFVIYIRTGAFFFFTA